MASLLALNFVHKPYIHNYIALYITYDHTQMTMQVQ